MRSCDHRRVATLLYDGLSIFEFGIVVEIFGLPRPELEVDWYKFETCSHQRGPLRTTGGIHVEARRGLRTLQQAGTIVISGWKRTREPPAVAERMKRLEERGVISAYHREVDLSKLGRGLHVYVRAVVQPKGLRPVPESGRIDR